MLRENLRSWAEHVGFDVRRSASVSKFLSSRNIDLVLDVGANTGQFAKQIRRMGYRGNIISFEPQSTPFQQLKNESKSDERWTAENCGLSDIEGSAEINISESSVFSSILSQSRHATNFDTRARVVGSESISLKRLDSFSERCSGHSCFLKIDTQGFEQQVLSGSAGILTSIHGILLELPIVHLYDNSWKIEEAISTLRQMGFVIAQIRPNHFLTEDSVSLIEVDCVFRRVNINDTLA